ncbi:MAG: hypothetical protein MJ016_03385 [Victivallaceae bacterium]|nr:hypothetical protein [Victivallaceae bacterium]
MDEMTVKKVATTVCFVLAGAFCCYAETSGIWICAKCNTRVEQTRRPLPAKCPVSGYHQWNRVADAGKNLFICRKCALKVHAAARPQPAPCPGGGYHLWDKL